MPDNECMACFIIRHAAFYTDWMPLLLLFLMITQIENAREFCGKKTVNNLL
jgi:hypothetical protein